MLDDMITNVYMYEFFIPGEPKGKKRPRHGRNGAVYTPNDTKEYEKAVAAAWKRKAHGEMYHGAVSVTIIAYYGIPKSASKSARKAMLMGDRIPTKKPDADNVAKIIMDGLNGIAYDDDKQVAELRVIKGYSGSPGVLVRVAEI